MRTCLLAAALAALPASLCAAQALSTAFTYQGRLDSSGSPVSGTYDVRFALFDQVSGGTQQGPTVCLNNVVVADGLLTAQVDFGAQFTNLQRFLEVSVRPDTGQDCSNGAGFTTLSPRQNLTGTPYALSADTLDGLNSTSFVQTTGTQTVAGAKTFSGPTYLNGFVGLGTTTAIGSANFVLSQNTSGFGGMYINTTGATGLPFYGYAQGGAIEGYHYIDGSDGNKWKLVNGGSTVLTVAPTGEVGLGTNTFTVANTACKVVVPVPATKTFAIIGGAASGVAPGGGPGQVPAFWVDTSNVSRCIEATSTTLGASACAIIAQSDGGNAALETFGLDNTLAALLSGNVIVTGNLAKSGGSFRIDHPLDPANKYLSHSFVESPDMMNIYNGNVTTDARGYATITFPDWFEALNRDFRYQLTVVDEANTEDDFIWAKVVRKVHDRQFTIRTSRPNVEVSWQVTGIRQDAWANAHRIPVEENKPEHERGLFLHAKELGQPEDRDLSRFYRQGASGAAQK